MLTSAEANGTERATAGTPALPNDNLFGTHFESLPGPAYIWQRLDDDFALVAYNAAAASLRHSNVAEYLGMRCGDLQAGSGHDLRRDLGLAAARGTVIRREVDYRFIGSQTVRRLVISLVPLSPELVVLHTDDVTEQRRTEQALRDSESKYRTIVDTAHEGIWVVDLDSVTTYVNQRAAEMLGYKPDEVLGRAVFEFIDESLHPEALKIRERRHTGLAEQFDFPLRHRDGADIWLSISASPITDGAGKVVGALLMLADISARKRAEQAQRESETRLRALLDANPDLVVRVHRDGRYLDLHYADAALTLYLPRPPADFIGRNVSDIFEPEFARQHRYHRLRALATGEVQRWEYARNTIGGERYFEARFVKSGEDEIVVTVRDITNRVRLEREVIASSERERTRIGHDLHDGLAQLLIGVKLMLEALKEKLAVTGSKHAREAANAAALVTRAIAQTGELAQGLSPIRKGGRLGDALKHLARQSQGLLGVRCDVIKNDIPAGLSDNAATHLYRIAQEAITNAAKHAKPTRIELSCERMQQDLVLTVSDDGVGLSENSADGGGMGMHIMRYRARSIGGELSIASRMGGGTIVKCTCPWPAVQNGAVIPLPTRPD
ncbi:MAG TPA: PAS domain S-box protein [Gammaproteobacteria bacterium]|nr:PAS domain S-box protein [Gammaproteobacteria bacterium]